MLNCEDMCRIIIGRTDTEVEVPILWPPHEKTWLIRKDLDAGKYWRQEEEGMTEDEMFGWHHWLFGHRFGWIPGVGDIQGGLACCNSWGHKESDTTERLNWTELNELDQIRAYYTKWGKSEREKQILYINTYIWNLAGWCWGICSQSSSGEDDVEDRLMDKGRRGRVWDKCREQQGCTHTYRCK